MDKLTNFWDYLSKRRNEDDFVDRMFYKTTPRLLLFAALVIFAKEYGGNAINCWGNPDWHSSWGEYANDYCFVEGTYYTPLDEKLERVDDRSKIYPSLKYYPWLAFLFAFQAFVLYLPYFFWSSFNRVFSGLEVRAFVSMANQEAFDECGLRFDQRTKITRHITNVLNLIRANHDSNYSVSHAFVTFYRRYIGRFALVTLYLGMKCAFMLVTVWQLAAVSSYLGNSSSIFDFSSIYEMFNQRRSWEKTAKFPRIGMCDFEIRGLESNVQKYTQQCVLVANMINEKIFMAVWFWYWCLISFGIINLFTWLFFLFFPGRSKNFILKAIMQGNGSNEEYFDEQVSAEVEDLTKKLNDARELIEELNQQLEINNESSMRFAVKKIRLGYESCKRLKAIRKKFMLLKFDNSVLDKFIDHIGLDVVLLFRLIEINSSSPVVNELLSQLFYDFMVQNMDPDKNLDKLVENDEVILKFASKYMHTAERPEQQRIQNTQTEASQ